MDWVSRIGNDRVVMILCALLGIARGTAYILQPALTDIAGHYLLLDRYVPMEIYGTLWYTASIAAIVGIFSKRLVPLVYGVYIGLFVLWTLIFLAAWVLGLSPTGFSSVATYLMMTVLTYLVARVPDIEPEVIQLPEEDYPPYAGGDSNA